MALIGATGPVLAATVIDYYGWRWNFVIISCAAVLRIVFVAVAF